MATFTTFINAKRAGSVEAEYAALEARASKSLTGIQQKAEAASRAMAGLTGGRGAGGIKSPVSAAYMQGFDQATAKADKLRQAQERLARENSNLVRSLRTTGQTLQIVQGPLGPVAGRVNAAADAFARLTGVTLGLAGAGAALFAYASAANRFVEIRSKLAPLYESQTDVNKALNEVAGIAQRARAGLEPVVDLYSRMKLAADQYGISQQRIGRITELASKAATLSGGTAQSREAGLYQFAQGFGSGSLAGDELKSIRENTLSLARALSSGLAKLPEFAGIDTSIGKLKELGAEGKLTADVIARALEASAGDIERSFGRLAPTMGSAMTNLGNQATMFVGRFEEATGIVGTLASGLMLVGNNLNIVASLVGGLGAGWLAVAAAAAVYSRNATNPGIVQNIQAQIAGLRARQAADRQALDNATLQRNIIGQRAQAYRAEQAAIAANIAMLERELVMQKAIAAEGRNQVRAGNPAGARMAAEADEKAYRSTLALGQARQDLVAVTGRVEQMERKTAGAKAAVDGATKKAAASTNLLKSGALGLLGALNPLGIAVALATTAFLNWALAESEAEKNARKVEDAQRKLATVIDFTTGKIIEQNQALLANAQLEAGEALTGAKQNYNRTRSQIAALGRGIDPRTSRAAGSYGTLTADRRTGYQMQAQSLLSAYGQGRGTTENLIKTLNALAALDPSLRKVADQVTKLGSEAISTARSAGQLQAQMGLLAGRSDEETKRRAQGDFSGGVSAEERASGRDVIAEAEALRTRLRDKRFAAETQKTEQLQNLEKRRAKMSVDEYVRERAQILATFDSAIAGIDRQDAAAARRAEREEERRRKAHERELARIERENEARDKRTERRQNILGGWSDDPKAVVKATRDIGELQDLVGKTMNGIAAITEANPLGQGIYTAEMAAGDAERIREGLQRPYNEYMEARQRDLNIQELILEGRDQEAEALRRAYDLYDQVGQVTMDQYQSILATVRAEEQMNDALAQRERLLAPLQEGVSQLRQDLTSAIEDFLGGGNPIEGGKNILKGLLRSFNRGTAVELAERITGGLDARVRDLMRGSVQVDQKIADYISALDDSGTGADRLTTALDTAANAANNAAAALNNIGTPGGAPTDTTSGMIPMGGIGPLGMMMSALSGVQVPASFYKQGVTVGSGRGDEAIFNALGAGALITDNLRSQSRQNDYYRRGLTPARVSDHTRTNEAWDVRIPQGMSFQRATDLIRKSAKEMGLELTKAIDETARGGTGRHGHYVFGQGAGAGQAAAAAPVAPVGSLIGGPAGAIMRMVQSVADFGQQLASSPKSTVPAEVGEDGEIVVVGTRKARSTGTGMAEKYNAIGAELGTKLDTLLGTKFMAGIGKHMGTALQGAQTGMMVSGIAKAFGMKQSNTGAAVGGAIGGVLGSMTPLGPLGGMIGSAIGGFLGGTIGGAFKKTKQASATVSSGGDGEVNVGKAQGSGSEQKSAASGLATTVGGGVQRIADMLGVSVGQFAVSIGVDKDGNYVVDYLGKGRLASGDSNTPEFESEEEAVKAAIANAIKDGALVGLSAASKTIIAKAKDLERALMKVQIIESIPKRLMALKDPVRYAITELNREFAQMISYLKEGGATAAQFAEAQELYDLERARAIEQATNRSVTALQDYIDNMLGGGDSPLNKRTVYQNAQEKLSGLAADVNAGKIVDADALLKAVENFQNASRELNGSNSMFFSDFDMILELLNKAKTNVTSGQTAAGDLPASPFADPSIQAIINGTGGTTGAVNNNTNVVGGLLQQILNNLNGNAINGMPTAINLLPSMATTGIPNTDPYGQPMAGSGNNGMFPN